MTAFPSLFHLFHCITIYLIIATEVINAASRQSSPSHPSFPQLAHEVDLFSMSKVTQDDVILILRTSYAGILLMTFGQTYQLFLCIQTLRQARKTPRQLAKSRRPYIAIMIVIMSLSGLAFVVDMLDKGAIFTTGMAITPDTEFPPDPLWWHIVAPLAIGGTHFAGDGLLIWRTYILWNAHSYIWCLSIAPYIGSFGILIAYTAISSKWALTEEESGLPLVIKLLTAYYISSISVNVIATTVICFRLLSFKRKMEKTLGAYRLTSEIPYLRIASILIESALPFTIFGVACAVSSALFGPTEIAVTGRAKPCTAVAAEPCKHFRSQSRRRALGLTIFELSVHLDSR